MRTFSWNIEYVECLQTGDRYTDVVTLIKWIYTIKDENDNVFHLSGNTRFQRDDNNLENFIPFSDLTTSQVIEWIETNANIEKYQYALNHALDEKLNPSRIKRQLPS
jgi:hypothetical protein